MSAWVVSGVATLPFPNMKATHSVSRTTPDPKLTNGNAGLRLVWGYTIVSNFLKIIVDLEKLIEGATKLYQNS